MEDDWLEEQWENKFDTGDYWWTEYDYDPEPDHDAEEHDELAAADRSAWQSEEQYQRAP